ncbi:MAG: hypothetical protein U5K75_00260 [Ahrensia sp.]|nr:hypothetical protein [Ahrensia sp.]
MASVFPEACHNVTNFIDAELKRADRDPVQESHVMQALTCMHMQIIASVGASCLQYTDESARKTPAAYANHGTRTLS